MEVSKLPEIPRHIVHLDDESGDESSGRGAATDVLKVSRLYAKPLRGQPTFQGACPSDARLVAESDSDVPAQPGDG